MSPRAAWAIARKDLLDALRTLRLLIFILLPIGSVLLYRAVLSSFGDITTARLVVYDAGNSRLPQVLAQTEGVRVVVVGSEKELQQVVMEARAVGGIALPPNYDAALLAGRRPAIQLFANEQLAVAPTQIIHLIEPALRALAGQQPPARIEMLVVEVGPGADPGSGFDVQQLLWIMFLTVGSTMTAVMVPASMLVEEKEQRTLQAVLVAPVSYADFVAGKGIAGLVYTLLSGGIILVLNEGLGGNAGLTVLVLLLSGTFLVEVGLLLGALFDSPVALNTWSFVVLLPLTLPGVLVPAVNLGLLELGAVEGILRTIPTYYMMDALHRTVRGTAFTAAVGMDLLILVASALLLFAATVAFIQRREA